MFNVDACAPIAPNWNEIEATKIVKDPALQEDANGVFLSIDSSDGPLRIYLFDNAIRLTSSSSSAAEYEFLLDFPARSFQFDQIVCEQEEEKTSLKFADLLLEVRHNPMTIELIRVAEESKTILCSATDGHFVRRHRLPPFAKENGNWFVSIALESNDSVYGLGEKWGSLNKRGQLLRSYNHDALGVNAEISYKNIPFLWNAQGWGALFHTQAPVTHAVGYAPWSQRSYCGVVENEHLDLFLFVQEQSKNKGASLIDMYTSLTGRAPIAPVWSGGVILSKAYYRTADEILDAAKEVRKRGMPCDVITLDGRAWQDTDTRFSFTWDESRYPDPQRVISELKELGFKVCIWEYPLISVKNQWFEEFASKGWLIKDSRSGKAFEYDWDQQAFGKVLTALPKSGIVDFTHADAYEFWRDAHKPLFDLGIDMIKADFGEQIESEFMLASNGESGKDLHNVYAYLYNRCVYEAAELYSANGPFLFSRSSWIGCQRFNSHWGGDPQADWEGMMANIRGGLSWGLSGAPFYATDVGGFYKDTRDDDLYVRWAQAAVFSAHYRLHGIGPREPWSYSPEANEAVMQALRLRYKLQCYLQKTMAQASKTSLPVQRPMVLAFPDEKQAWPFENQFMFGDDILVAPCHRADGIVEVYLPQGQWQWFDVFNDAKSGLEGGRVYELKLELSQMATFVREGTQIPLNADVISTDLLEFDTQGNIKVSELWC